eukprot:5736382-Prymnesium_polylepis.1
MIAHNAHATRQAARRRTSHAMHDTLTCQLTAGRSWSSTATRVPASRRQSAAQTRPAEFEIEGCATATQASRRPIQHHLLCASPERPRHGPAPPARRPASSAAGVGLLCG